MTTGSSVLTVADAPPEAGEEIAARSLRSLTWGRLRRDKVAVACMVILAVIILLAAAAPLIERLRGIGPTAFDASAIDDAGGLPIGPFGGISAKHPLGVEPGTGRDNLARLLDGARISLFIALSATIVTCLVGTTVGIVAGYLGGIVDAVLGRLMDLVLSFPLVLMLIALTPVVLQRFEAFGFTGNPARIVYLLLALSTFGWPGLARLVRGQVVGLREREFVDSAVAMGAGTPRILFREILPNLSAPILVYATITLPSYIAAEAALSFLGVGVVPPQATWGALLAESVQFFQVDPALLFIPGVMLFLVVFTFNVLGDAVRDALDPRASRQ
jgi:peptide/nickel transport system permease protein